MARQTARCFHAASQKELLWSEQSPSCHCHGAGRGTQCFSCPGCLPDFTFPHAVCVSSTSAPGKMRRVWAETQSHAGWAVWKHNSEKRTPGFQGISCLLGRSITHWQGRSLSQSQHWDCLGVNGAAQMDQQKLFNNYLPEQFLLSIPSNHGEQQTQTHQELLECLEHSRLPLDSGGL